MTFLISRPKVVPGFGMPSLPLLLRNYHRALGYTFLASMTVKTYTKTVKLQKTGLVMKRVERPCHATLVVAWPIAGQMARKKAKPSFLFERNQSTKRLGAGLRE